MSPIWIDDNTIAGEMSDADFLAAVQQQMTARVEREVRENRTGGRRFGNDGNVEVYSEQHEYQGVSCKLAVVRYFSVDRTPDGSFPIRRTNGMNRIGKWAVVESADGGRLIPYELSNFLELSELLYHDTLHSGQEDWSVRQQWEWAEGQAREDIDTILGLRETFDAKVAELRAKLEMVMERIRR